MGSSISFKAKKSLGYLYIGIPLVLVILAVISLSASRGNYYVGPGGLALLFVILGVWYLKTELIVFSETSVSIKLALLSKKHVIEYRNITSIDTSKKNKLIINWNNKPVVVFMSYFEKTDADKILQELKTRTGK